MGVAVRVLIVDDDDLVRHALRAFLTHDDRVVLVGEATDGSDVVQICEAVSPDVVLMDIRMPVVGGIEATRRVLGWNSRCRVVALTTLTTELTAIEVLRAGACGYLLKSSRPAEIIDAILSAHTAERVVSPGMQTPIVRDTVASGDPGIIRSTGLNDRELQIVQLIATGLSNTDIAEALSYAEGTVKADIRRINQLWQVHNRLQIVLRATELGIVTL
ncbi:response regulator transcription factor [Cryobacterium sp. Y11]|uniref:response regulator transcription factor n=1 Tax=Cryobacterium sp. Y11 TaxID=2045016 RepID=UPI000CE50589|nr:response regulator transcription factor [Cryobacterium sp. Y11]